MKITRELLNKLSSKKQEEFKTRIEIIDTYLDNRSLLFVIYIKGSLFVFAFSLLVLPLWMLAFGLEMFNTIATDFNAAICILILASAIGAIVDFSIFIIGIYKMEKIKQEYFVVEVKAKK